MSDNSSPEKSPWGWKALIIAFILSVFFLGFFYLAVSNEPDYMPSQKQQNTQQHAFKNAPAMSEEALARAEQDKKARETASVASEPHQMGTDSQMNMNDTSKTETAEHGH